MESSGSVPSEMALQTIKVGCPIMPLPELEVKDGDRLLYIWWRLEKITKECAMHPTKGTHIKVVVGHAREYTPKAKDVGSVLVFEAREVSRLTGSTVVLQTIQTSIVQAA